MDHIDRQLLALVQHDGKQSHAELGNQVGLSTSSVNERLRKLQQQGIIQRFVALVEPEAVGLHVCAFVRISVEGPEQEITFPERVHDLPEVMECHTMTGEYSYLLKIRTSSTRALERFLRKAIKPLPGVGRTNTLIVLRTTKESTELPINTAPS